MEHAFTAADLQAIGLLPRPSAPDLDPSFHGLEPADLETEFSTGSLAGPQKLKLRELVALLKATYAGSIGAEFMHISDVEQRQWVHEQLERAGGRYGLSVEDKKRVLEKLVQADGLERYLHTKYVGQKRFSLEGGDSLIPLLDELIRRGGNDGMKDMVVGMAHRGRLNVLVNTLGKSPQKLFAEFEGKFDHPDDPAHSGDVKYHMGFSANIRTTGRTVHVALAFNPSHLEIVNPVVAGSVRARQTHRSDLNREHVVPVLIHGDAAFAGQGVNMELLNMSQARGFAVGGAIHVVVNNQVGFTTSNPNDARSTLYCTDVAKMVNAPVFHVNGDDPEAVLFVSRLAFDFRQKFKRDVVIDLVCYRRHGHNEADEPAATQPLMYQLIRARPPARELYAQKLTAEGVIGETDAKALIEGYRARLEAGTPIAELDPDYTDQFAVDWTRHLGATLDQPVETGASRAKLDELNRKILDDSVRRRPALARRQDLRGPQQDGRRRAADGLGLRREPGLCGADRRWVRPAPGRPGLRPRHVLPPPRGAARPEQRRRLRAAGDGARRRQRDGGRLAAQRRSRDGIRIRLLDLRTAHAGAVGRPVRRLRQRRAGGHRPVHLVRRGEVGPPVRSRPAAAARLRGTGPGAFLRTPGALSAAVRAGEHAGLRADHAGADVPHAAPPDAARRAQAADRDDAEVAAAPQAGCVDAGRTRRRPLPAGAARHDREEREEGAPRRAVFGQGLLRPGRGCGQAQDRGRRHRARRAAVPVPARGSGRRTGQVRRGEGDHLVPGGADEPGRLVPDQASSAGAGGTEAVALLRRSRALAGAGLRSSFTLTSSNRPPWSSRR